MSNHESPSFLNEQEQVQNLPEIQIPKNIEKNVVNSAHIIRGIYSGLYYQHFLDQGSDPNDWYFNYEANKKTNFNKMPPNIIVLPLRGAGIYEEVIKKILSTTKNADQNTLIIKPWISRNLVSQAISQGIYLPDAAEQHAYTKEEMKQFATNLGAWAIENNNIYQIIENISDQIPNKFKEPVPLIIDDKQDENYTATLALVMVREATGINRDPFFMSIHNYENIESDKDIVVETFKNEKYNGKPLLQTPNIQQFLSEVVSGYIEIEGKLVEITNKNHLQILATKISQNRPNTNPLSILQKKYGINNILNLRYTVQQKLAQNI